MDGQGSSYPIAECDNASRVIKYVGILGLRYASYGLVDMRIHDINVEIDLNRHNPNMPTTPPPNENPEEGMSYDGTSEGRITDSDRNTADSELSIHLPQVVCYWTGWWPLFHIEISQVVPLPEGDITIEAHTAKNIASQTEYSACSVDGPSTSIAFPVDDVAFVLENVVPEAALFAVQFAAAYLEWAIRANAVNPVAVTLAAAALTAAILSVTALPVVFADALINQGLWNHHQAGLFFLAIGWTWLWGAIIAPIFRGLLIAKLTHPTPQSFLDKCKNRFSNLATFLEYSMFANAIIVSVGVFLLARAAWHFLQPI